MLPDGIVYAPPAPKSAWLASAGAMSPSLTLIRSTLPRRSFVFSAERRESTVGALVPSRPPLIVSIIDGRRRARQPGPVAVICGWSDCGSAPRKYTVTFAVFTGPPVAWTLPAPTLSAPRSAVSICAAVELNASGPSSGR